MNVSNWPWQQMWVPCLNVPFALSNIIFFYKSLRISRYLSGSILNPIMPNSISGHEAERDRERLGEWSSCLHLYHLHYQATSTHHISTHHTLKYCCSFKDRQQPELPLPLKYRSGRQASQPTSDLNKTIYSSANGFTRYQMIKDHSFPLIDM